MLKQKINSKKESFIPIAHHRGDTLKEKILIFFRKLLDFQFLTIWNRLSKTLGQIKGGKILDVGCGNSPFQNLINLEKCQYIGLDFQNASAFNYHRSDVIYFDGKKFPLKDNSIDFVLCTEVIEHVYEYQQFVDELYRVLKKSHKAIVTVPWSARNHYIPFDFFRYTPDALKAIFSKFSFIEIHARGTDITVIVNKLIVAYFRLIRMSVGGKKRFFCIFNLFYFSIFTLFMPFVVLIGHLSLWCNIGSQDDCLGYTIILKK